MSEKKETKKLLEDVERELEEDQQDKVAEPDTEAKPAQQKFPFARVDGELRRTYIYPNNNIPVDGVYGISPKPNGGHRLLTKVDGTRGITMEPGWISIIYQGDQGVPYVFTE